ncbi:MAG: hypothetical protein JNN07_11630 [Verrucomicrobiales bacterium]|nr:hypothetical protein [Verrucomicrobiales bacterium]
MNTQTQSSDGTVRQAYAPACRALLLLLCVGIGSSAVQAASPGAVVAWGNNDYGQTAVPVAGESGVTAIAAGASHTVALRSDGSVVAWGINDHGETTVPVAAQSGVVAIASGWEHTVALKNDGSLVAWGGGNDYGQTTVPESVQSGVVAIAAGWAHTVALKNDGSVVAWGQNEFGQTTVPLAAQTGVTAIAAGDIHTVALKSNGSVLVWGNNFSGQTNVPEAAQIGVTAIAAGGGHTAALKSDGSVVAWGQNEHGQANVPEAAQSGVMAIAVGGYSTLALKNGGVVAWGQTDYGLTTVPVPAQSGVVALAMGSSHSVALVTPTVPAILAPPMSQTVDAGLTASFSVGTTGYPIYYQWRKDGTNLPGATSATYRLTDVHPNQAGAYTVALSNILGSVTSSPPAVLTVNAAAPAILVQPVNQTVNAGRSASVTVVAIGAPLYYQWYHEGIEVDGATGSTFSLGLVQINQAGRYTVVVSNFLGSVTSTVAAVLTVNPPVSGAVVTWGDNQYGQTTVPVAAENGVTMIAAGYSHAVALKADGSIVAWGANIEGETSVPAAAQSGVTAVAAGTRHTVALKSDGSVVAWGWNMYGQTTVPEVAQGGVTAIAAGYYHTLALKSDGSVEAWGYNSQGQTTVPDSAKSGVIAIAAGAFHTLALKKDGSIVAWGENSYAQSTVPEVAQSGVTAIAAGYYHNLALKSDGGVVAWGDNYFGQTTVPIAAQSGVIAIAAGNNSHSVALRSGGGVVAWGYDGATQTRVPTAAQNAAMALAAGNDFTMALVTPVAPAIIRAPTGLTVNAGQSVSMSVAAAGVPLHYQWRKDGTNLSGATGATYSLAEAQPHHAGIYTVVVTNFLGSVTSAPPAVLGVNVAAPKGGIYFSFGQSPTPAGSSVRFCNTISGAPPPSYQWQFNGVNLPGQAGPCLELAGVSSDEEGSYRLIASNLVGEFISAPLSLVVDYFAPSGSIHPVGVLPPLMAGTTLTFCSTITGGPPPSYQWQFNNQDLASQTSPCLSLSEVQTNQSGSYRLIAVNSEGTLTSAVAVVSVVHAPPTANIYLGSGHSPTTVGSHVMLCASVSGGPRPSVQWQFNGTNLLGQTDSCLSRFNVQTDQSGRYSVVASNILGVVTSAVAVVSVIEPEPVLAYFASGFPPFAIGSSQSLCLETSLPEPLSYQWRFNGTDLPEATNSCHFLEPLQAGEAGDYSVVVTSASSVSTSPPIAITVYYAPPTWAQPGFSIGSASSLVGDDVILHASYVGSPSRVQWRFNGMDLPGETNVPMALLSVAPNHAGEYSFTAGNVAGMTTSSVVRLDVSYQAPVFAAQPADQSVVEGAIVRLTARARGGPPPEYFLEQNGTDIAVPFTYDASFNDLGGFNLFDVTAADAGGYRIIASNSFGSATSRVATLTVTPSGPLDRWTRRNPLPQSHPLLAVAHGTNQFVAVGERGTILTSPDGSNWALQSGRADVSLNGVTYGGGLFVAVGGGGTILSSADGTNWAYRYTAAGTFLNGVTHAQGRFVAVGSAPGLSTLLLHSTDGLRWERVPMDGLYAQQCVGYGNGRFIAGGSGSVIVSTDGTNWVLARSVKLQVEGVTYADGLYVAVGDDGSILVSPDSVSWVARPPITTRRLLGVTYGVGRFVAVGARGELITSVDTAVWTAVSSGTPDRLETIDFSGGLFIATGENGTVITSTDGTDWTRQNLGITRDLDGMHGADGVLVIVGKGGSILASMDGVHYATQPSGVTNDLHGVTWGGGLWVAVGEPGIVLTSSNRVDWIAHDTGTTSSLKGITYAEGQWIAVGTEGTVVRSTNGVNWGSTFTTPPHDLNAVAHGNGMFLIAGDGFDNRNGSVFRSFDGLTWTQMNYDGGKNLRGVAFANELFLFAANDGVVITTAEGGSYNSSFPQGGNLRAATWAHGLWIVVGNNGTITTSPDLLNWTRRASRTFENQHQVALLDGRLLVIGNRGDIIQSGRFLTELGHPIARPEGGFHIPLQGVVNQVYRMDTSTNLVDWIDLLTFTNRTEHSQFIGPIPADMPQLFYRLRPD